MPMWKKIVSGRYQHRLVASDSVSVLVHFRVLGDIGRRVAGHDVHVGGDLRGGSLAGKSRAHAVKLDVVLVDGGDGHATKACGGDGREWRFLVNDRSPESSFWTTSTAEISPSSPDSSSNPTRKSPV